MRNVNLLILCLKDARKIDLRTSTRIPEKSMQNFEVEDDKNRLDFDMEEMQSEQNFKGDDEEDKK